MYLIAQNPEINKETCIKCKSKQNNYSTTFELNHQIVFLREKLKNCVKIYEFSKN